MLFLGGTARAADSATPVAPASVAQWQEKEEPFLLVDVRPTQLYDMKHARGAVSIPAFVIDAKPIPKTMKVVLYDNGAGATEAGKAAEALQSKGYGSVYILTGGLTAWEALDLPIVAPPGPSPVPFVEPISAEALQRLLTQGAQLTVIDVRSAPKPGLKRARIQGARAARTAPELQSAMAGVDRTSLIVVFDDGNGDALERAEALRRQGFKSVKYLYGGTLAWDKLNQSDQK